MDQLIIPKLIFFFILIMYLVDTVVILLGEIQPWSLKGVRGLNLIYWVTSFSGNFVNKENGVTYVLQLHIEMEFDMKSGIPLLQLLPSIQGCFMNHPRQMRCVLL